MDPFVLSAQPRLDLRLARRLAEKKAQLDRYRPLSPHVVRRLHDDLRVLLTYHSNALEGNTLSLQETQLVIEYGLTVGGHSLREYLEATNHAAAFAELVQLADATTPLTSAAPLSGHAADPAACRPVAHRAGHHSRRPTRATIGSTGAVLDGRMGGLGQRCWASV